MSSELQTNLVSSPPLLAAAANDNNMEQLSRRGATQLAPSPSANLATDSSTT